MLYRILLFLSLIAAVVVGAPTAHASATTDITITRGDGTTTPGTIHAPEGASGRPGVVLVYGSGTSPSTKYAEQAEAFARAGIVALRYDKRTEHYTAAHRDYSLLADDALSAVAALRNRPEVDPNNVGIWGLSEGGWVAPLAASRSADIAFLITIGANSGAPAPQQSWADQTKLRVGGVRGSMVDTLLPNGIRQVVGAGQFAEADYDQPSVLARIQQPVLGIWGDKDRLTPPGDSLRGFQAAFDQAGKTNYTLRTVRDTQHSGFTTTTGFDRGDHLSPEYTQLMGDWVNGLPGSASGQVDQPAVQQHSVTPLQPLAWWESTAVFLTVLVGTLLALAGFTLTGFVKSWRLPSPGPTRILVVTGVIGVVGTIAQILSIASSRGTSFGPLIFGRTLPWLTLQVLAVCAVVALALVVARSRHTLAEATTGARLRWALLICGGTGFVLWALYFGLLLP
ncbi:alpha/beta hydrolase family protein [Nocardia sp. NPDC058666]|uniref:alpha/beta hydrolase family protein n=1 Tax=Nocardia sp. NPDC058666 TaxID=3346587 RepID=UPI003646F39B